MSGKLEGHFELIHKNFPDLDMNIVIPNENNMISFMEMIEESHRTIEGYFSAIGIGSDEQEKIKEKLTK